MASEVIRVFLCRESLASLISDARACKLVFFRQCFSVSGWICLTYVSAFLPLGFIQLTQNTIPVITAVIAFFVLGERITFIESMALSVCFAVVSLASFNTN